MDPEDYNYTLPNENLALEPAVPRDSSKLFIYDTRQDKIVFDTFSNLDKYLPDNSSLVLNDTKVLPARVVMKKQTGGKVVTLFLVNEISVDTIPVIVDRKINVGEKIYFENMEPLEVVKQKENVFCLKFFLSKKDLFSLLQKYGAMPIPPYLKKTSLGRSELLEKYQTIFAEEAGSAAAPTASLHFTKTVFERLGRKGISRSFVTLHVGLGTFAPLTDNNLKSKKLHEEYYFIPKKTIETISKLKSEKRELVSVGTTVTRTLESFAKSAKNAGKTDLFIFPPFEFKMVDHLITNFHLPKSSLMMLVEAFLHHKKAKKRLVDLYNIAIDNNFRFYSFGDAMLVL